MTNYERIKAMSVEEMAMELLDNFSSFLYCAYTTDECLKDRNATCKSGVIKWLNSEVEK